MLIKSSVSVIFLIISFAAAHAQKPSAGTEFSIVNGLATYLPKPEYPQEAKDFCASGIVSIKVEIDEKGDVSSAEKVAGDELLREPSIEAAKKAKFRVTTNNREAIKVKGIIVYNFPSGEKCIVVGIVNKRALNLPLPKIPNLNQPRHLQINEEQIVAVQIIVDVSGKVTAARALTGLPMLRPLCEKAARQAEFSPVMITPIKVKALLVYKFKPDRTIDTDIEKVDKTVVGTPINLVEPPPPFCNCRFGGKTTSVMVEAKTDEKGNVVEAKGWSGHPVLKNLSEKAALESKFLPTNIKAKITIIYHFEATDESARDVRIKSIEIKEVKLEEKVSNDAIIGKAINLVKPPFPSGFGGKLGNNTTVLIEAQIDEKGNVISAKAISGHPVLRAACVAAARGSKFSPTTISGVAVKAKTLITYEYILADDVTVNIIVNGVEAEKEQ